MMELTPQKTRRSSSSHYADKKIIMSKKGRKKKNFNEYILLNDVIYILRISPKKMHELTNIKNIEIYKNEFGTQFLKQNDFKELAYCDEIIEARIEATYFDTERRMLDESVGNTTKFLNEVKERTEIYSKYIDDLKSIHEKYKDKVDIQRDETALCAAYIIFAKVINLLQMTNLCLSNSNWDAKIIFRLIDEAIMLAEYFIISEESTICKKHIKEWFRENKSPANYICREAISKYMHNILPNSYDTFQKNISKLYNIKSKSIHHSLNSILETYNFTIENGSIKPVGFDFRACTYASKIMEMTIFFQSSIWTAFQGFFICFNTTLPLEKEDSNLLLFYETDIFQKQS